MSDNADSLVDDEKQSDIEDDFEGKSLAETLLAPTRIYIKPLLELMQQINIKALSHITGGGILENIPRVLPPHTQAVIETQQWQMLEASLRN